MLGRLSLSEPLNKILLQVVLFWLGRGMFCPGIIDLSYCGSRFEEMLWIKTCRNVVDQDL